MMRTNRTTWAALAALVFLTGFARADGLPRTIRVTGQGKATAPPDMATVQTGVVTRATTAQDALVANNKAMENILAVLKKYQVAPKDVQTSRFSVQPIYKRDEEGRTLPEIVSFQVTNQVRVRVRELGKLGAVLDALVTAGSNQVSGISFGIADPTGILDEARKAAVTDARHRARLYAQEAGVRLGKVQTISEQPIRLPQSPYLAQRFTADAMAAVPVATGEEEFRVTVYVVFALEVSTAS